MTRSELMSRIRSKGNQSTEMALARVLRKNHITGWRRQQKVCGINVDFVFRKLRLAVFADGCFWHACSEHSRLDKLNNFWYTKVMGNKMRDMKQGMILEGLGWKVIRVWEHSLKGAK